jgi:hypothetical protein
VELEAHLRYQKEDTIKVSKMERVKEMAQVSATLWIKAEEKKVTIKNLTTLTPDTFQRPTSQRSQRITIHKQNIFRIVMQQKSLTPRPGSFQRAVQHKSQRAPSTPPSKRATQKRRQIKV